MPKQIQQTAKIVQRSDDFIVSMASQPGTWDCGRTIKHAVENFLRTAQSHGFSGCPENYRFIFKP